MTRVVAFVFGGRKANMELQMPFVYRILADHPQVEWHIWNLARSPEDAEYLNTLASGRILVRNDFYGQRDGFNRVFMTYAHWRYTDAHFVKLDDDVVFIQTERFGKFLTAINPESVISANVINNGACTASDQNFDYDRLVRNIPLLDVHMSARYAKAVHAYFMEDQDRLLAEPLELVPTEDWLSINLIGYTYSTAVEIASKVGRCGPMHIAGRHYLPSNTLGDEGMVNTLPRQIMRGFLAVHLSFGSQDLHDKDWRMLRAQYRTIGQRYLA